MNKIYIAAVPFIGAVIVSLMVGYAVHAASKPLFNGIDPKTIDVVQEQGAPSDSLRVNVTEVQPVQTYIGSMGDIKTKIIAIDTQISQLQLARAALVSLQAEVQTKFDSLGIKNSASTTP